MKTTPGWTGPALLRRLLPLLLLGAVLWLLPVGCQAATTCKVQFRENNGSKGTDNCMTKLTKKVKKGKKLALPTLPPKEGYVDLGWTGVKEGKTIEYKAGAKVTITKNTTFYAVRKKIKTCTVTFNNNKGTNSGSPYKELRQVVKKKTQITLPQVPAATGYTGLGWTTQKGASSPLYEAGSKVTITKSCTFYAVRKRIVYKTVQFRDPSGGTDQSYDSLAREVIADTQVTLPEILAPKGYTFLGWSVARGKKTDPDYLAGTKLAVKANMTLYAVLFPVSEEENPAQLAFGWQQSFRKIVMKLPV